MTIAGVSAYISHVRSPHSLQKMDSVVLNSQFKVHLRLQHVNRTYVGKPFTNCDGVTKNYTQQKCVEMVLLKRICQECNCSADFFGNHEAQFRYSDNGDFLVCRYRFLWVPMVRVATRVAYGMHRL